MQNNTRSRSQLKSYFVTHAIPRKAEYADFIDGMLNAKDDGIGKTSGEPLSIEAGSEDAGRKVVQLYETAADGSPEWTLSLRPKNDAGTQKRGLAMGDASSKQRLFIDRVTGNVGAGTIEPVATLHVAGDLQVDGALQLGSQALALSPGQRVSGIQVIDFAVLEFVLPDCNNANPQEKTFTFSQPVVSARALVRSFLVDFNPATACEFYSNSFAASCTTNGKDVTVRLTLTLTGRVPLGNLAGSHGTASVLVIAVLENAV
jgi:hypothetical protein